MKNSSRGLICASLLLGIFQLGFSQSIDTTSYITVWKSDNPGTSTSNQITIPGTGTNYTIYWEKVADTSIHGTAMGNGSTTVTLPASGTYRVKIGENFTAITFNNGGDRLKILDIEQWGEIVWTSFSSAYYGCWNLNISANDTPILNSVTSFSATFGDCFSLNSANLNSWNTSSITNMSSMFYGAVSFNQSLQNWNTSHVITMSRMFESAGSFNQPINNWNTGNVSDMRSMFENAGSFDQFIGSWNTSKVTNMIAMFLGASSFNQPLNMWNTANVIYMDFMFANASIFNQSIGSWLLYKVESLNYLFTYSALDCENYSSTLIGWASNPFTNFNVYFSDDEETFALYGDNAITARNALLAKGWEIAGDAPSGVACGSDTLLINTDSIKIIVKAILGSSYFTSGDTMSTKLSSLGLIPVKCPFDTNYILESLPVKMVDWVKIELADVQSGDTVFSSHCCCLLNNGIIQNIYNDTILSFPNIDRLFFSIRIKHRNHLSVRSNSITNIPGTPTNFDFRNGINLYIDPAITGNGFHNVGQSQLQIGSRYTLWPGDANGDGQVKYQGSGNDRGVILTAIGGSIITNTVTGYHQSDITLNGQVKYQGSANDRAIVLSSIGGSVITKVSKAHD